MPRNAKDPRAADLMEPLRVVAGRSEPVGRVIERMRAQGASFAPVVSGGRVEGVLTLSAAEGALRHGLGGQIACGRLILGGAPVVPPSATLRRLSDAARGAAPAVLVSPRPGIVAGSIARETIDGRIDRIRRATRPPAWIAGEEMIRALREALGGEGLRVLRLAGRLATRGRIGLYLVGGIVRDLVRGHGGRDLDLAVQGEAIPFAEQLARHLDAAVRIHHRFGTAVIALPGGVRIDVATARREWYAAPAALPRVAPGSMIDDLFRRDVTVNAMAIRLDGAGFGRLRDDLGGREDLGARILRVTHALAFVEDPTRGLRVTRLAARLGFRLAPETKAALALALGAGSFGSLSGERLRREYALLFAEPDPAAVLDLLDRTGILRAIDPSLVWDGRTRVAVRRLIAGARGERLPIARDPDRLAEAALGLLAGAATLPQRRRIAERLGIRGDAGSAILEGPAAARRLSAFLAGHPSPISRVRACERAGDLAIAIAFAAGGAAARRAIRGYLAARRSRRPAIGGADLRAMGLPPGPEYRRILRLLRERVIAGHLRPGRPERLLALALVRRSRGRACVAGR